MASISTTTALLIAAGIAAAGASANAYVANDQRREAKKQQAQTLEQAKAAANQTKGALVSNVGDVSLESEESLEDAAIRSRSKKNRLRVDKTGLSLAGMPTPSSNSNTGLKI